MNYFNIRNSDFLFFFPSYHTGGAEKVHLDILNALTSRKKIIVFFTKASSNDHYWKAFINKARCIEVSEFIELNLRVRSLFEFMLVSLINKSKKIQLVFGANSTFFYDIIPRIKPIIQKIDLIHAFSYPDYGFESYSIGVVSLLKYRITISDKSLRDFKDFYSDNQLGNYLDRVKRIHNLCELTPVNEEEIDNKFSKLDVLNVAWVGRFSVEKRPEIFLELARLCNTDGVEINFNLVTDLNNFGYDSSKINLFGKIDDSHKMKDFLVNQHILIITSYREGLPLVFMEAISQGAVVISTKVGALPDFIQNNINGFLIEEENLLCDLKNIILKFNSNSKALVPIAQEALKMFNSEFLGDSFVHGYQELFIEK